MFPTVEYPTKQLHVYRGVRGGQRWELCPLHRRDKNISERRACLYCHGIDISSAKGSTNLSVHLSRRSEGV